MKKLTSRLQNVCIVSTLLFVIGSSAQAADDACLHYQTAACPSFTSKDSCDASWSYVSTRNDTGEIKIVRCQWRQDVCINSPRSAMTCSK